MSPDVRPMDGKALRPIHDTMAKPRIDPRRIDEPDTTRLNAFETEPRPRAGQTRTSPN
jgi:hypothetical protein